MPDTTTTATLEINRESQSATLTIPGHDDIHLSADSGLELDDAVDAELAKLGLTRTSGFRAWAAGLDGSYEPAGRYVVSAGLSIHRQAHRMEVAAEIRSLHIDLADLERLIASIRRELDSGGTPLASDGTHLVTRAMDAARRVVRLATLAEVEPLIR